MRAVIYARYSSELQLDRSIEDQIADCKRLIETKGWTVHKVYTDRAISGASALQRPAYQQMLTDMDSGQFDMIVAEAMDRLGRNLSDCAHLGDRAKFRRVGIHTIAHGELTPIHIAVLGMMSQWFLTDLAVKTKRGQRGLVTAGKIPAGKAYGYDLLSPANAKGSPTAGQRAINPAEAAVIVRIFELYANGVSPRDIAARLNAEGIKGPDGRTWADTTIRGQNDRGTGILNNGLYRGVLEWNRCSYIKNPQTGKKTARPNPPSEWTITQVPDLRIVSDELWNKVKARQGEVRTDMARDPDGNALNATHRRKFLLSGRLYCGECGGPMTIVNQESYGCATKRSKGTCSNAGTVKRTDIEERVLGGLRDRSLAPDAVKAFMQAYLDERKRLHQEANAARAGLETELAKIDRKINALVKAIEDGLYDQSIKQQMIDLRRQHTEIEAKLALADAPPVLTLHPKLPELYRAKVADLITALNSDGMAAEAGDLIRSMVDSVILIPDASGGPMRAELHGDLANIISVCDRLSGCSKTPKAGPVGMGPALELSVVAGIGFEPMTSRL